MEEFLNKLRISLNGKVSANIVEDTISYYRNYINDALNDGKTIDEVLNDLGDPSLIARSVVTANKASRGEDITSGSYTAYDNYAKDNSETVAENSEKKDSTIVGVLEKIRNILKIIIIALVLVLIISGLARIALAVFVPVLIVYLVWKFIMKS